MSYMTLLMKMVLYFSIYFYLCSFNYSLFFVVYFLVLEAPTLDEI